MEHPQEPIILRLRTKVIDHQKAKKLINLRRRSKVANYSNAVEKVQVTKEKSSEIVTRRRTKAANDSNVVESVTPLITDERKILRAKREKIRSQNIIEALKKLRKTLPITKTRLRNGKMKRIKLNYPNTCYFATNYIIALKHMINMENIDVHIDFQQLQKISCLKQKLKPIHYETVFINSVSV